MGEIWERWLGRINHGWEDNTKVELKRKRAWGCGLGSSSSLCGLVVGVLWRVYNRLSGSIKGREFKWFGWLVVSLAIAPHLSKTCLIIMHTFNGKNWSLTFPRPRHPRLLCPHMYRSPWLLTAARWPMPALTAIIRESGWNSLRPKSADGICVGSLAWVTTGPFPRIP